MRKQTYTDATSGVNNTCYILLVYKDAEVDSSGKIVFTNGSNQINSTLYQKNGRHAAAISQFLHTHQKGEKKHIQIFDNDLDRVESGSQMLQFNKGLPAEYHNALQREGVEYFYTQNTKKSRQGRVQTPTHVLLGGKDIQTFANLVKELEIFHKNLETGATNNEHSLKIVESLLLDVATKRSEAQKLKKTPSVRKKQKVIKSEEDDLIIPDNENDEDMLV